MSTFKLERRDTCPMCGQPTPPPLPTPLIVVDAFVPYDTIEFRSEGQVVRVVNLKHEEKP